MFIVPGAIVQTRMRRAARSRATGSVIATTPPFDDAWFERKLERDELLVAEDEGIVGYLMWTKIWRMPWVEFVRVLVDHRRQGVGRALVNDLEDRLRAAGGWMLVSSSSGNDKDAIAWHRAIGFEDGGRIQWKMWRGAPPEVLHYKEL